MERWIDERGDSNARCGVVLEEREMSDFAVGRRPQNALARALGRPLGAEGQDLRMVEGDDYEELVGTDEEFFDAFEW